MYEPGGTVQLFAAPLHTGYLCRMDFTGAETPLVKSHPTGEGGDNTKFSHSLR